MNLRSGITLVAAALLLAGCYHATIDTGVPASGQGIHQDWAPGWAWGLVGPPIVETAKACPNGVAKVETQASFLNMIVHGLTLGIYVPWQIDVACAAGGKSGAVPAGAATVALRQGATAEEVKAAFQAATERSEKEGVPVYVTW